MICVGSTVQGPVPQVCHVMSVQNDQDVKGLNGQTQVVIDKGRSRTSVESL